MQATPAQGGGMQNPGGKVALNPQPLPPGQRLSNADVIKMANGHVPESVILSSVQSSRGNFDLSPSGCSALRQANVSEQVLKAMATEASAVRRWWRRMLATVPRSWRSHFR